MLKPLMTHLMTHRISVVAVAAAIATAVIAQHVRAQEGGKTVADGVYTEAQAIRGSASYDAVCSGCHRADMGGADGPALRQDRFENHILLIGDDPGLPYQRPPLSKAYPLGKSAAADLRFRPARFYEEHRMQHLRGVLKRWTAPGSASYSGRANHSRTITWSSRLARNRAD